MIDLVEELKNEYPVAELIEGENNQKEFIKLYGAVLKTINILSSFDKFENDTLLSKRDIQDYHSMYIDLYNYYRNVDKGDKVDIADDIVFEMELVKQIEVNIDYILTLIEKYHESNMKDKEILISVNKAIMASPDLRNKKDLIEEFINSLDGEANVFNDFASFMNSKKKEELDKIIKEENLDEEKTYRFIRKSFENGMVETYGTEIVSILPPMSMFDVNNSRTIKKKKVVDKLLEFFDKFFSISSDKF